MPFYNRYQKYCDALQHNGKYRKLPAVSPFFNNQVTASPYLDFASNDYLGLSRSQRGAAAAQAALARYGTGSTGSRLLSGNNELFESFETQIAADKKTERALIFNSGFQANVSILAALLDHMVLGARPLVFFDRGNHASLYQGVFLSEAELIRYHHNDLDHLAAQLEQWRHVSDRPKFIVCETVHGMDGDVVDLARLATLAQAHHAFLYLDEAHATGIYGEHGYGVSTIPAYQPYLQSVCYLVMGTFSKALGASGAYAASDAVVIDYLINKAGGFIYSTAPSPMVIAAAAAAWNEVKQMSAARNRMLQLGEQLRLAMLDRGWNYGTSTSFIVPLILGTERAVTTTRDRLLTHNIIVSAIRPPTVPTNSARLKIALNANHSWDDCELLLSKLDEIIKL